ncbi:hypothetical protein [Hymenobacter metallicola]|uniref:Uncharacterized protein n=1 Tax=Hymenobacter metallicola TaxID=2563114 RepID=A0A4Z0Q1Z0_9BACT|nr:hypothetical protein [Hymenobacter metallicola]TGE23536.1 hypothetical protein E5K02_20335 [Hymenobacter metallicola]
MSSTFETYIQVTLGDNLAEAIFQRNEVGVTTPEQADIALSTAKTEMQELASRITRLFKQLQSEGALPAQGDTLDFHDNLKILVTARHFQEKPGELTIEFTVDIKE